MNRLAAPDEPPVTYVPGSWVALVTDDLCVLADAPADSRTLGACWTAAVTGQGLDAVLALVAGTGTGNYAAATRTDEGLRVVVSGAGRGEVAGEALTPSDGVSDEFYVGRPPVRLSSGATAADEWAVLPLPRGMALAGAVGIGMSAAAEPAPEPTPAPRPRPTPAPLPAADQTPAPSEVPLFEPPPAALFQPPPGPPHEPPVEAGLLESLTWREPAPVPGPPVLSTACRHGHPNPPWAQTCRECGEPVPPQQHVLMPRPPLGALALSTGEVVTLDDDVVLGRQPQADPGVTLVPLTSAVNDVSRSHVRIILSDWLVQAVDLDSTNGTVVTLPGQEPVRLRPHDPFTIVPGSTVALGHEVTMRYELP